MKIKKMTFLLLFFATLTSCHAQVANNQMKTAEKKYYVLIETSYGNMTVELYNETPKHRDNFLKLVNEGFYDGLLFHRVINNFMIQGGDPKSKDARPGQMLGDGNLGYTGRCPSRRYGQSYQGVVALPVLYSTGQRVATGTPADDGSADG